MAANLGFKGPLQRQVMGALKDLKVTMQRRGREICDAHKYTQTDISSFTNKPNFGY